MAARETVIAKGLKGQARRSNRLKATVEQLMDDNATIFKRFRRPCTTIKLG